MKARLIIAGALVVLLALMQYRLWIAPDSLPQAWQLRKKVDAQMRENSRLELRNQNLDAEVRDLKQGHAAIEARARNELGMIKPGETFYQIIRPQPPVQAAANAKPPHR